jgi:RNA polymerase primary sigma factor
MKIPLHFIDAIKRLEEYISLYIQENKKYPTIDQMTKSTGFSPKKIRRILNIIAKPLSLDTPVFYKDSLVELKDTLKDQKHGEPSENVFQAMVSSNIRQLLAGLSERERKIIIKRYGLEDGIQHTLDEVGYYFNLTRERIRQIEHKALDKLKVPSKITLCKKLIEGE